MGGGESPRKGEKMKRRSEMTWKEKKLDYMTFIYGDYAKKYDNEYGDDRQLFVNMYNMIIEALGSLEDEPNLFVKCAVDKEINEYLKTMDRIARHFDRYGRKGKS